MYLEQIGQQNLAFGLKFKAKGVIDCYEKEIQNLPFGTRRDIEFEMIEGDFQLFQGKWCVEQVELSLSPVFFLFVFSIPFSQVHSILVTSLFNKNCLIN